MIGFHSVLYMAAALCVSGRGALLLLLTLSLTQLFVFVTASLWSFWGLSHKQEAAVLTAVAVGGALWRCFSATGEENAAALGPLLPLMVVFVLCGLCVDTPIAWRRFLKAAVFLLIIGCVRELLADASLFSFELGYAAPGTTFGRSADGSLGIGGVLLTALAVWAWGGNFPIHTLPPLPKRSVLLIGVFTAAVGCALTLFPSLSVTWRFFAATLCAIVVGLSLLSPPYSAWILLFSAVGVCLPSTLTLPTSIVLGAAAALLAAALPPLVNRLGRAPLPRRFSGIPLCLTAFAVVLAIYRAI